MAVPATTKDYEGFWVLVSLDPEMKPRVLKEDPWPAKCQFFGHYSNGIWLHQQTRLGACKNQIPDKAPSFPVNVTWKMPRDGLLIIDRPDYKIIEIWKVDKITRDSHLGRTNLNKGDLLMQMFSTKNKESIYARLLRRVK